MEKEIRKELDRVFRQEGCVKTILISKEGAKVALRFLNDYVKRTPITPKEYWMNKVTAVYLMELFAGVCEWEEGERIEEIPEIEPLETFLKQFERGKPRAENGKDEHSGEKTAKTRWLHEPMTIVFAGIASWVVLMGLGMLCLLCKLLLI